MTKLSNGAWVLLRHVMTTTGEKEINESGQEIFSPRRLNGEEASQRRHFVKAMEMPFTKFQEDGKAIIDKFREQADEFRKLLEKKNPKKKDEEKKVYDFRIDQLLNNNKEVQKLSEEANDSTMELSKIEVELKLTDKTLAVLKKYFDEFGEKSGFILGDDDKVEEIVNVLK